MPAFHGRASEHPDLSWQFFVGHYDDAPQAARNTKLVPDGDPVPARRHARRLHRAQRDDHRLPAQRATGTASPPLTGDTTLAERPRCAGTSSGWRRAPTGARPQQLPAHPLAGPRCCRLPFVERPVRQHAAGTASTAGCTTDARRPRAGHRGQRPAEPVHQVGRGRASRASCDRPLTPFEGLASAVDPNDWRVAARSAPRASGGSRSPVEQGRRSAARERLLRRRSEASRPAGRSAPTPW